MREQVCAHKRRRVSLRRKASRLLSNLWAAEPLLIVRKSYSASRARREHLHRNDLLHYSHYRNQEVGAGRFSPRLRGATEKPSNDADFLTNEPPRSPLPSPTNLLCPGRFGGNCNAFELSPGEEV